MELKSVLGRVCYLRARSVAAFFLESYEVFHVKTNEFCFRGAWGIYIRRSDNPAI